ncbi:hypothetical protein K491DRAFT_696442 [Lophiostoma macrostomum CBS 122681]|uniref:Uncharacterized protein n=1 Tax=Lophiostoma macrostomum CBS 122681 TaxID=1314788 RepID=A0A6A6SY94_9PLEO|nr:hypothetical protein K491DRAFT_696442 [Lophiostoma macrostomum CBS 122681]
MSRIRRPIPAFAKGNMQDRRRARYLRAHNPLPSGPEAWGLGVPRHWIDLWLHLFLYLVYNDNLHFPKASSQRGFTTAVHNTILRSAPRSFSLNLPSLS